MAGHLVYEINLVGHETGIFRMKYNWKEKQNRKYLRISHVLRVLLCEIAILVVAYRGQREQCVFHCVGGHDQKFL